MSTRTVTALLDFPVIHGPLTMKIGDTKATLYPDPTDSSLFTGTADDGSSMTVRLEPIEEETEHE